MNLVYVDDQDDYKPTVEQACRILREWLDDEVSLVFVQPPGDADPLYLDDEGRLIGRAAANEIPANKDGILRVLDLGCGTGKTAAVFLATYPRATVRAVDLFEEMLKHARARLARFRDRVEYVQGDLRHVALGSAYDVCASALAIHHLLADEKRELFSRIYEALEPGGRFLMIDWTKFRSFDLQSLAAEVAERHAIRSVPKAEIVRAWIEHWREKNVPETVEDLTAWLLEAGFSSAECVMRYYGIALICAEKAK
jgi:tRNA (cmo5U34)-methyltransferase